MKTLLKAIQDKAKAENKIRNLVYLDQDERGQAILDLIKAEQEHERVMSAMNSGKQIQLY